jgi:speckle-type POZ protein
MGNVWVSIGFTLYSGDPSNGTVIHDVPSNGVQPIQLTKAAKYQCVLVRDYRVPLNFTDPNANNQSYPYNIQLNRFGAVIGAKITIIQMGYPSSDSLRDDLGALLSFDTSSSMNQNKFSDVKLVILSKESGSTAVEFPAHKVILAARSPVFAKMFEHDMQESANNRVKVDDIQPDVFKEVLTYMYTGQVPKFSAGENMVYELLYAADKYQLDDLKSLCERQLISILNFQNAARITQCAHLHNAPELKKATLQFISKNATAVRATKEWEQVKQCPEILDEVIQAMDTVIQSKN